MGTRYHVKLIDNIRDIHGAQTTEVETVRISAMAREDHIVVVPPPYLGQDIAERSTFEIEPAVFPSQAGLKVGCGCLQALGSKDGLFSGTEQARPYLWRRGSYLHASADKHHARLLTCIGTN